MIALPRIEIFNTTPEVTLTIPLNLSELTLMLEFMALAAMAAAELFACPTLCSRNKNCLFRLDTFTSHHTAQKKNKCGKSKKNKRGVPETIPSGSVLFGHLP